MCQDANVISVAPLAIGCSFDSMEAEACVSIWHQNLMIDFAVDPLPYRDYVAGYELETIARETIPGVAAMAFLDQQ